MMEQLIKWGHIALKYLAILAGGVFLLLYCLPAVLLQMPFFQSWAGDFLSQKLSKTLKSEVHIERVALESWRQLRLEQIAVLDSLQRPALSARSLKAGTYLIDLLWAKEKELSSLRFFGLNVLIDVDSLTGRSNVQHILEALSQNEDTPSELHLDLNNILVRDASLRLLQNGRLQHRFDSIDIKIEHLDVVSDSITAELSEFKLNAFSGFHLNDLKASLRWRGDSLTLQDVEAYLPNSYLHIPILSLRLDAEGWDKLQELQLKGLSLALSDVQSAFPELPLWLSDTLLLSGQVRREGELWHLSELEASLTGKVYLRSQAQGRTRGKRLVSGSVDVERLILDSSVGLELMAYLGEKSDVQTWIPLLERLGQLSYRGGVELLSPQSLRVKGYIQTDAGQIQSESTVHWEQGQLHTLQTQLKTKSLDLGKLLPQGGGEVQAELGGEVFFSKEGHYPTGNLYAKVDRLQWQKQSYTDIYAEVIGRSSGQYRLSVNSNSSALPLSLQGQFALREGRAEDLHFVFKADKFPLHYLGQGLEDLSVRGEFHAGRLDKGNINADVSLPLLHLSMRGKMLDLSHIHIDVRKQQAEQSLHLSSPWLRLSLNGQYEPKQLWYDALSSLGAKMPVLRSLMPEKPKAVDYSVAQLAVQLDSLPYGLRDLFELPLEFRQRAELRASLDSRFERFELSLLSPEVGLGQHRVRNFYLNLLDKKLFVGGDAYLYGGTQLIGAGIGLQAEDNRLRLSANLGRDSLGVEQGMLNVEGEFSPNQSGYTKHLRDLRALIRIAPSRLRIHTQQWEIAPATIAYKAGALQVKGLSLSTEGRQLAIDGAIGSWFGEEALGIKLSNINLRYILEAAGVYFDLLDTNLTGLVTARLAGKHLLATAAVRSPHFYVNKQDVGAIDIGLNFSTEDLLIKLKGDVLQSHGGRSFVDGWIKPAYGAGMDLHFDAEKLNVGFIGSFMSGFLSHLRGYGTGQARLHGLFKKGVTVSGNAFIQKGQVGVRALGTDYHFEHQVHLDDERIHLDGLRLYDSEGHSALLRGYVGHQCFDNFDINLKADNMRGIKVLHTNAPKLMPAYGKAYASGTAIMRGTGSKLKIWVDVQSEEGTDIALDFNTMTAGRDEGLMRFLRLRPDSTQSIIQNNEEQTLGGSANIDLNLKVQITPMARLSVKLGEDNSTMLRGQAEGGLNISAPAIGNPEVYGTLSLLEGEYLFNLQQLALKRFSLKEGGSIAFRGNAMKASLNNLNAVYMLTANISDLDESISRHSQRTNIPVHCLLSLSGEISKPEIRFGLELPGVDTELERRVHSLLNTPDAVTKQMLYLMALGKFYTSDAETRSSTTTNNWTSVASSALSEQLSSILGGLSEHIKLGTSIRTKTTAFEDTDIELNFSSSFWGNRLQINGNVGYHDNPYLNGQYLGEFDFEYKLNRSGTFRLKGYNRYNTMYQYLRQSFLTQGFGILYRQRFDGLADLLRLNRKLLPPSSSTPSTEPDSLLSK